MSEDFLSIAKNPKYGVYCLTSIGPIEVEEPEYRNGVTYMVKFKEWLMDECECGWCGNCREQLEEQRKLEERSDYYEEEKQNEH